MQLAIVAAGFSPGEADHLRRSMAAWRRRGGLEKFEQRLIDGMAARGFSEDYARQIYQQILGFGEYGFPESHSASFALLVYVSAWLKCYEPAAFCAALVNAQPMGFYAPAQLVQDARRHGVDVRPVDVTASTWDCTLEKHRGQPRCCRWRERNRGYGEGQTWSDPGSAAPRPAPHRRADRSRRAAHRRGTAGRTVCERGRSRPPRAARPPRSRPSWRCGGARGPGRPSPRRGVGRRRHRAAAAAPRRQHLQRGGPRAIGTDRGAGHRRRLPDARPHAAPAPHGALARPPPATAALHRGRHRRGAAWPHRAHRRHRHRPPAAGHRERRHFRHAGR